MPQRISYSFLEPIVVRIVVRTLAEELYPDRESSRIAFVLQGEGGKSLLASALALPRQPYYKSTLKKAAALLRSLVKNHPFIDGIKRFALAMVTFFLAANEYALLSPKEAAVSFVLRVAQEDELSLSGIEHWLHRFCLYGITKKSARQKLK